MKTFLYTGAQAHNSTVLVEKEGKKERADLRLFPGEPAEVDETHPVIKSLIDGGLLVEVGSKQNIPQKNSK